MGLKLQCMLHYYTHLGKMYSLIFSKLLWQWNSFVMTVSTHICGKGRLLLQLNKSSHSGYYSSGSCIYVSLPSPNRSKIFRGRALCKLPSTSSLCTRLLLWGSEKLIYNIHHIRWHCTYMHPYVRLVLVSTKVSTLLMKTDFSQEINFNWFNLPYNSGYQGYQIARITWLQLAC